MNITLDELCEGLPEEIKLFIKYAKEMKFYQEPDYEYLKGLLLKIAKNNNIDINNVEFDWESNIFYNNYIKLLYEENEEKEINIDNTNDKKIYDKKNDYYIQENRVVKEMKNISENKDENELIILKFLLFIYLLTKYHWFFIILFFINFD